MHAQSTTSGGMPKTMIAINTKSSAFDVTFKAAYSASFDAQTSSILQPLHRHMLIGKTKPNSENKTSSK